MRIFIRADGGHGIGLGHIMRTLVLADQFRKRHNEVIYLCKKGEKFDSGRENVRSQGFSVISIHEENLINEIIEIQEKYKADLLITDSYDVEEGYFNKLKNYFKLTGYIDDVNKCRMNVDFIVNQNINSKCLDYSKNIMKYTKLFLGTEYCMIREEFKENYIEKDINISNKNILLTLGGMDDNYNTLKILEQIKNLDSVIHVVIGNAFKNELIEELYRISSKYSNIIPYKNANMSLLMSKCDYAISACGSTLYELCAMEVPAIGVILADNQKDVGEFIKKEKLIFDIISIEDIDKMNFEEMVKSFISDIKARAFIIKKQRSLVNKNGAEKLVDEVLKLI